MRVILLFASNVWHDLSKFRDRELYSLIAIRSGGENTIRIIDEILIKPKNANQIANILNLDYKTVRYHLDIICNHEYATKVKFDSNYSYFPSDKLIKNLEEYNNIKKSIKNDKR